MIVINSHRSPRWTGHFRWCNLLLKSRMQAKGGGVLKRFCGIFLLCHIAGQNFTDLMWKYLSAPHLNCVDVSEIPPPSRLPIWSFFSRNPPEDR